MTQAELIQLLRDIEWSGGLDQDTCPDCRGVNPSVAARYDTSYGAVAGHCADCRLLLAIQEPPLVDYRALFLKYLTHVGNAEGVTFVSSMHRHRTKGLFTDEEWAEIQRLDQEAD